MPLPSVAQLTRALKLATDIETLEAELASLMGAAGPTNTQGNNPKEPKAAKRGRPPGVPNKKKSGMSEEGRQRIAEAQKKRWAAKKKTDGKK